MPAMPIADSSAPIVVGISATSSAISVVTEIVGVRRTARTAAASTTTTRKISVSAGEQDVRARSRSASCAARRPRRARSCGPGTTGPGSWVISTTIRSREHARAAGDRAAVAAGLADHRRRLAGDRRLVDRGDALDHGAVAGDQLAGLDDHDVAAVQLGRRARRCRRAAAPTVSVRIARSASAWARPRPSASASARLAKTTVSHSQTATVNVNQAGSSPPPSGLPPKTWISQATVVMTRADLDHEHHRVADLHARVELAQRCQQRRPQELGGEQRGGLPLGSSCGLLVEGEVELERRSRRARRDAEEAAVGVRRSAVDAGERQAASGDAVRLDARVHAGRCAARRRTPSGRATVGVVGDQLVDAARAAGGARRRSGAPGCAALACEMCGSTPEAEVVTASTGTSAAVRPGS